MSANLNILKSFVNEFKETYTVVEAIYEDGLVGDIRKIQDKLLRKEGPSPRTEYQNLTLAGH